MAKLIKKVSTPLAEVFASARFRGAAHMAKLINKIFTPLAKAFASASGYDLIEKHKMRHPSRLIKEALARKQLDLIIDVGANNGQFAKHMRDLGYTGTLLSFEPSPDAFSKILKKSSKEANWLVEQCALGASVGNLYMNVFPDDALNSFLPMNDFGHSRYEISTHSIKIDVKVLDAVLDELISDGRLARNFRAFLKLDTQGYDLEVLKGASKYLRNIEIIQTEACVLPIYETMPNYLDTFTTLEALGFRPASFSVVSRDKTSLALVEFDLVAVRLA